MTENLSVFTLVTLALKLSMMKAKYSLVVATMVPFRPADAKLAVIVKEQELIKKILQGDKRAFDQLCAEHHEAMLRWAGRILHNPEDAKEAVQDATLKVYTVMRNGKFVPKARFRTYLYIIVYCCCIDIVRREKNHNTKTVPLDETLQMASPIHYDRTTDLQAKVADALDKLSTEEHTIIYMRESLELSYEEISVILGKDRRKLERLHYHVIEKLREILGVK